MNNIQTDYLWEAVGNLMNASRQPDYDANKIELLEIAENLQLIHDEYFGHGEGKKEG